MFKERDMSHWFKVVTSDGQKKKMSLSELKRDDPLALLYFYEKHIEIVKK